MANIARFCGASLSSFTQRSVFFSRHFAATASTNATLNRFNKPLSGAEIPRSGGITTAFRLPFVQDDKLEGLDACFVGIPMDQGATNRSGQRLAPRAIRNESVMVRPVNMTGAVPFDSLQVADIGDVPTAPYNLSRTLDMITAFYRKVLAAGPVPLTLGGDHTLSLPVLRAFREHYGRPVGLIQIDAHPDLLDELNGEKIGSLTPFRRALEEDLIDPKFMVQIGLRGTLQSEDEITEQFDWAQKQKPILRDIMRRSFSFIMWLGSKGVKIVLAEQCWHKSLSPLMDAVRKEFKDVPTYITFDIDGVDPSCCPGTGTHEIGGLTSVQVLEIIRGCRGLNIVGGDVTEVNPLYDPNGGTALMAATILFEMLCVLPGVKYLDFSKANWNTFHF